MITLIDYRHANTYLYYTESRDDNGFSHGMLVDASCTVPALRDFLTKNNVILDYIVITHGHYDHLTGFENLIKEFPDALVSCGKNETQHFSDIDANVSYLFEDPKTYTIPNTLLKDGDEIKLLDESFKVLETPGHTPGSICLYNEAKKILFTGDLLFLNGIGRTDFKYGDYHTIVASLRRIAELPGDTVFYSGHGEQGLLSMVF